MVQSKAYLRFQPALLALVLVVVPFLLQRHYWFNMWDEGYLWYGAQRILKGEVPIRDFMSYDPGRYYWAAFWMWLFGEDGLSGLRLGGAIFQFFGLFCALTLVDEAAPKNDRKKIYYLAIAGVALLSWMFIRQKVYDISLSIFLVGLISYFIRSPSRLRFFLLGVGVGLVAAIGRNHGVYGVAAVLVAVAYVFYFRENKIGLLLGLFLGALGICVGFSPNILMALFIPGFAVAFKDDVGILLSGRPTNLPIPTPWPWKLHFDSEPLIQVFHNFTLGVFFVGLLTFGIGLLIWVICKKLRKEEVNPTLAAAAFLALPYAHYSFSRADGEHLANGIYPMLIGCFVAFWIYVPKRARLLASLLTFATLGTTLFLHPYFTCLRKHCVPTDIGGERMFIEPKEAVEIQMLDKLIKRYAPNGESFLAVPYWPGAYAVFHRRSPLWENYALWPQPKLFEEQGIDEIQRSAPRFTVIMDFPLDGRENLRFKNTHPLTYKYIVDHNTQLSGAPSDMYQIYLAKDLQP